MVPDEEDYSDYSRHINTSINGLTLVMGFTFTAVTLLLTRLGNPSSLGSQLMLLFLVIVFYLDAFIIQHLGVETLYYCKRVPPRTRKIAVRTALMFLSTALFGLAIPLMFLLFDLVYLCAVTIIIWLSSVLANWIFISKPLSEYHKNYDCQVSWARANAYAGSVPEPMSDNHSARYRVSKFTKAEGRYKPRLVCSFTLIAQKRALSLECRFFWHIVWNVRVSRKAHALARTRLKYAPWKVL